MIALYTAEQVRAAETAARATLRDGTLMQRAATGLGAVCLGLLGRAHGVRVVLLVGAGDNGGDTLYVGAVLAGRGASVRAVLLDPERAHAGGLAALRRAGGRVAGADDAGLDRADLVLDGIVGIGGRGGLRPAAAELAAAAAAGPGLLVAVDLPSGVDADTGAVDGTAFPAQHTVTFGAVKRGLVVGAGRGCAGLVHLVDIGLGPYLPAPDVSQLTDADAAARVEPPSATSDKYTGGVVGVVAGSAAYPGAGVLCTGSALRTRPGLVRYAGTAAEGVRAAWPEAIVTAGRPRDAGRVQAWVVGPGMGTDEEARSVLAEVLAGDVPVVVDADALTLVSQHPELVRDRDRPTLLTPHDREFARLFGDVGPDRVAAARRGAAELGCTVLLKGDATVVADADGTAFVNATGTPWLATAGTGDVLSGIAGALLATQAATGLPTVEAAAVAAHVHGRAGQLAAACGPLIAGDVVRHLPEALGRLFRGGGPAAAVAPGTVGW
ncbi:yjeF C-terminal region, hydroxyethylthiazole kinase-related/yjeF N-terminal region [Modestobacter sp. DSM 44400]|uniref:NAD(P)H-hydrate dehydratase n=1 Tax=Modestobacter sp. DSM 44400 TaxID=1550230 RepID=UPI00089AD648|nr:NAD(P)H-hydrate dehydratase [Modestobacter sp. DSM 44400]SDX51793.1 yjeF C-terminal region, hydroxyethylthiazole kinase-related/yjeF N-terminal region [Modestobacter sp. DSM 44400]